MVDLQGEGCGLGFGCWVDLLGKICYFFFFKVELIDVREFNFGVIQFMEQYIFIFS